MTAKEKSQNDLVRLFRFSEEPGSAEPPEWLGLAKAYKSAADELATRAMKENKGENATLYPIVYLYRHSIELQLKSLCMVYLLVSREGNVGDRAEEILHDHDLTRLMARIADPTQNCWRFALTRLPVVAGEQVSKWFECIKDVATEMARLDSRSTAFRYPIGKKLESNAPDLSGLSLVNMMGVMEEFSESCRGLRRLWETLIDLDEEERDGWRNAPNDQERILLRKDLDGSAEAAALQEEEQE